MVRIVFAGDWSLATRFLVPFFPVRWRTFSLRSLSHMNPRRLFVASCISLIASAFSFVIRQDVLPAWGRSFDLSATHLGVIGGMAFWGMATAMVIGSFVVDALGMKRMLGLAFFCHLVGTVGTLGSSLSRRNRGFTLLGALCRHVSGGERQWPGGNWHQPAGCHPLSD